MDGYEGLGLLQRAGASCEVAVTVAGDEHGRLARMIPMTTDDLRWLEINADGLCTLELGDAEYDVDVTRGPDGTYLATEVQLVRPAKLPTKAGSTTSQQV